jgi:disease resistance protein RPM1
LTLLDVAEAYYDELLSRNIIQLVILPDGTESVGHCCVHDMMLEVIVSKSLEANFVSLVGSLRGGTSYDPVRRLCVHVEADYVPDGRSMKHARSLTTFGDKINVGVGKLLGGLANFTLLRVLDLEDCQDVTNRHMKQVCRLFLLRLLNLNCTNITVLPSEVKNLEQLQSLMLYDTLLDAVPGSIVNLEKLEYLSFQKRDQVDTKLRLPHGLRNMKALQRLTLLEIGNNDVQLATEIGELVQLRELEVFVQAGHSLEVQQALARSVDKLRLCYLHEDNIDVEYMGEILAAE